MKRASIAAAPTGRVNSWKGWLAALAGLLLSLAVAGCVSPTPTDPEYRTKLAMARTDCTGREIVGIWVSKFHHIISMRRTLLFRPDGTGRERGKGAGTIMEADLRWRYEGGGVWSGSGTLLNSPVPGYYNPTFTIRYTGSELVRELSYNTPVGTTTERGVFVRASDEAAVDDHLRKR
jgi:hypothetical protein